MNVVSVPDGAPAKVKEAAVPAPDADTKYSYLWNCRAVLDQATRVLMATDNDPPGHALAEELARRLGTQHDICSGLIPDCFWTGYGVHPHNVDWCVQSLE